MRDAIGIASAASFEGTVAIPLLEDESQRVLDPVGPAETPRQARRGLDRIPHAFDHEFFAVQHEIHRVLQPAIQACSSRHVMRKPHHHVAWIAGVLVEEQLSARRDLVTQHQCGDFSRPRGAAGVHEQSGVIDVDVLIRCDRQSIREAHTNVRRPHAVPDR